MRFIVEQRGIDYFQVTDKGVKGDQMNKACSIFFGTKDSAEKVCLLLNMEWHKFLRNPK
jgi:hypothetical protein